MNPCSLQAKRAKVLGGLPKKRAKTVDAAELDQARSAVAATEAHGSLDQGAAVSVVEWGAAWLDRREQEGVRSVSDDRTRWRVHVLSEPWASWPLARVTPREVRAWWSKLQSKTTANPTHKIGSARPLAAHTIRNVLQLVKRCFGDAVLEGLIDVNHFAPLKMRRTRAARVAEPWTILRAPEQRALLDALPYPERLITAIALGTGLRQREQWALRLDDVDVTSSSPHVLVRFGKASKTKPKGAVACMFLDGLWFEPTKGGRVRRVPLFGISLESMRAWLGRLSEWAPSNPHRLVFPRWDGNPRPKGRPFRSWEKATAAIGRASMRWHDLRHCCASSLLGGWWGGRKRSLEEVRVMLGHSSQQVTERYAHFALDVLDDMAREMRGEPTSSASALEVPDLDLPGSFGIRVSGVRGTERVSAAMVDGVSGDEVEAGATGEEPGGRLSSEVEQRFRNPETGPSPSDGEAEIHALQVLCGGALPPAARSYVRALVSERDEARAAFAAERETVRRLELADESNEDAMTGERMPRGAALYDSLTAWMREVRQRFVELESRSERTEQAIATLAHKARRAAVTT